MNGLPRVFLTSCLLIHFQSNVFISLLFHLFFPYFNLFVSIFTHSYVHSNSVTYLDHRHSWYGITLPFFTFCFTYSFSIQFFVYFFVISSPFPLIYVNINLHLSTTGTRGTELPSPFFSFLFYIFIFNKVLYFFFISSWLPYFNLLMSKFMQSYLNINLHVSTLYIISTFIAESDTRDFDTEG